MTLSANVSCSIMQKPKASEASTAPVCPLCLRSNAPAFDLFPVRDICTEYRRQLGVSVEPEFPAGAASVALCDCSQCGLQFFEPPVTGSADFYARLSQTPTYYSTSRWEFEQSLKWIGARKLVDVGCGDGYFLSLVPHDNKLGLEFNPAAVARARARGLDVRQSSLATEAPGSVGAITLFQVLEHLSNPRELLADAARALAPQGLLIIAVPNNDAFIGRAIQQPLNAPPHHVLRWNRRALEYLTQLFPLAVEMLEDEPLSPEHVFVYRRTLITEAVRKCLGARLPLMRLTPATVFLRKTAGFMTMASMKLSRSAPKRFVSGHSVLAVYRRTP